MGNDEVSKVKEFLSNNGAFLRGAVSGRTDYIIVCPDYGCRKLEDVLEQAEKGHTIEVIFYEDFIKYIN